MKLKVVLSVMALGLAVGQVAWAQTEFADGEFDFPNDWSSFGPYNIPADAENSNFEITQQPGGGNPGAYGETNLTRATVSSGEVGTWAAIINDTLVWDPQASGPLGNVDFEVDWRRPAGTGARTAILAVKQDGFVWLALAKRLFLNEDGWFSLAVDHLVEADFVALPGSDAEVEDQPLHPNFSAAGAPISFGIGIGRSCPASSNCTTIVPSVLDFDNLKVTVHLPFFINAGVNDAWFNMETAGQGFFFTVFPDLEVMFLAWFTYDAERPDQGVTAMLGEPGHRWVTAFGDYAGDTAVLDVELTSGGVFDAMEPMPVQEANYGTITIVFFSCNWAKLTYDFPSLALAGTIDLIRIANDNLPRCQALNEELQP